jgi:hypothetical protein
VTRMQRTMEALQQASMKLGETMYEQPGAAAGPSPDNNGSGRTATGEEDVVEGEFTEA